MKGFLRVVFFCLFLVTGIVAQDGFDLADAFDDGPTPVPKVPEKPKPNDDGLDLNDAFGPDLEPKKPKKPAAGGDSGTLDILDAFDNVPNPPVPEDPKKPAGGDLDPKPNKPAVIPPKNGGGGGSFGDADLFDVNDGEYKPDGGRSGGRAEDPNANDGAADQPQEAGSGQIAGIASAIGVAILGAASSYFAYQKKKLCFKIQGGVDPESGKGTHDSNSEPQVLSNLLRTS
ncbi:CD99 molecule [Diretmus argenteus]